MRHLELLTRPSALVEADESTSKRGEGEMDVLATLIADGETAEAVEPSQCSLHYRSYNGAKFPNAGEVPTGLSSQASEVALGR